MKITSETGGKVMLLTMQCYTSTVNEYKASGIPPGYSKHTTITVTVVSPTLAKLVNDSSIVIVEPDSFTNAGVLA